MSQQKKKIIATVSVLCIVKVGHKVFAIVNINNAIDIPCKRDGRIPIEEFGSNKPSAGDKIEVLISYNSESIYVSYKDVGSHKEQLKLKSMQDNGEVIELTVVEDKNFIKAKHKELCCPFFVSSMDRLKIGDEIKVKIFKVSHRFVMVEQIDQKASIEIGQRIKATVKKKDNFFAYCAIDGINTSINIVLYMSSDINIGDDLAAEVISMNESLIVLDTSCIQEEVFLKSNFHDGIYDPNKKFNATITGKTKDCLKVLIGEGDKKKEGIIPMREIHHSRHESRSIFQKLEKGNKVKCTYILLKDNKNNSCGNDSIFSIKNTQENPISLIKKECSVGHICDAIVLQNASNKKEYVFILVSVGNHKVETIIHQNELCADREDSYAEFQNLKEGNKLVVALTSICDVNNKVVASARSIDYSAFSIGSRFFGKVIEIIKEKNTIIISIYGILGSIPYKEDTKVNDKVFVELVSLNKDNQLASFIAHERRNKSIEQQNQHQNLSQSLGSLIASCA